MEANLKMTIEGFVARYILPAARELARKIINGDPLTDEEKTVCRHCGIEMFQ